MSMQMTSAEYDARYGPYNQRGSALIPAPGILSDVAKIFTINGIRPLTNAQINREYLRFKLRDGATLLPEESVYDESRIAGVGHCYCPAGQGEFVLLPFSDPGVQEGSKRYMKCRKCHGNSHL